MFIEYPKALYKGSVDDGMTVNDAAGEALARADGYEMYSEIHARVTGQDSKEEATPAKRGRKPKAD